MKHRVKITVIVTVDESDDPEGDAWFELLDDAQDYREQAEFEVSEVEDDES